MTATSEEPKHSTEPATKVAGNPCVLCGKSLATPASLRRHLTQVHPLAAEAASVAQQRSAEDVEVIPAVEPLPAPLSAPTISMSPPPERPQSETPPLPLPPSATGEKAFEQARWTAAQAQPTPDVTPVEAHTRWRGRRWSIFAVLMVLLLAAGAAARNFRPARTSAW